MATYDLEEQEQIAEIKAWWKQYGNRLLNAVTLVALVAIAWQGWNWYQRNQSGQAAMVFSALQSAVQNKSTPQIKAASGELIEKYGRTTYAHLGALLSAKAMMDAGDMQTAKVQLLWAAEHAKSELGDIARLRCATLLLDEKNYDQALKQLESAPAPAFRVRFQDLRGDILAAQGKKTEALTAYQEAMTSLSEQEKADKGVGARPGWQTEAATVTRNVISQKIDSLGGGKS